MTVPCHAFNGHMAISIKFDDVNLTEKPTCLTFQIGKDLGVIFFFSTGTNLSGAKFNRDQFTGFVKILYNIVPDYNFFNYKDLLEI